MAVDSFRDRCVSSLRRMGNGYGIIRSGWRAARSALAECIRLIVPRSCFAGLPKGLFSLFDQVQAGVVVGEVFFTEQEVPAFEPDSLVKRSGLQQDEFQPWPVFSAHIRNARLFGKNLVLLNDRKQACREFMFAKHSVASDESYRIPTFQKPLVLSGRWTSLVSRWDTGYWHFLMDVLPRLHSLPNLPEDTGILVRGPVAEWQWDFLRMLGVADRVRPTTETHLIVEDLYYLSHTSMTGACNPFAVQFLREKLLSQTAADSCQMIVDRTISSSFRSPQIPVSSAHQPINLTTAPVKLYLKRGPDWTRGIRNQDAVCDFLAAHGWSIVEPEKLGIMEQIKLFSQTDVVCAAHGSAMTNMLWMPPGGTVLELVSDNFMLGAFEWLARAVGLEHRHLVFQGDHRLSFDVDMDQLEQAVSMIDQSAKI